MANTADIDYATILGRFRNLRRMTIWMQPHDILKVDSRESMLAETHTAAKAWLSRLVERKEGARYENILLRLEIFYNHAGDRNTEVARMSYKYDGILPVQGHLHAVAWD